jgi:hypothetical protein
MRVLLQPAAVAAVVQVLIEIELGTVRPEATQRLDYEWIRDGVIAELRPTREDEPSYPSGQEMVVEAVRLVREAPHAALRKLVETLPDRWLRIYANEAQILYEIMRRPPTLEQSVTLEESVMPRSFLVGYLRSQIMSPTGREVTRKLRKALGWKRPPRTPIGRVIEQLAQAAQPRPSTTSSPRTP